MSRIYDALKVADGMQASSLAQLIDETHVHASATSDQAVEHDFANDDVAGPDDLVLPSDQSDGPSVNSVIYRSVSMMSKTGGPLLPFGDTTSKTAEQYRILRTNLLQHELNPRIIGVASATPGDGKTLTAINLAGILALKGDSSVLLVDSDLRQRSIAKTLGIDSSPGLTNVIRGDCSTEAAIVHIDRCPGLFVLPAGDEFGNPAELLDSPVFRDMVSNLSQEFSYIVFDTTPMTEVTDFRIVQQVCEGILTVVRPDHTSRAALAKASKVQQIEKALGTVINAVDDWFLWRSSDHYRYYPREAAGAPGKSKGSKHWLRRMLGR